MTDIKNTHEGFEQPILDDSLFKGLLESAPDSFVVVDQRGTMLIVNAQTESMFGYDREELLGQPVEMLVPDARRGTHPNHREKYFGAPRVRPMGAGMDLSGQRKDGSTFPVEISLSPIETTKGTLVVSAIRDVSERFRMEAALRESERLHRSLAEASPVGVFRTDPEGHCTYVNERWSEIAGLSLEEARGDGWTRAIHDEDRGHVIAAWSRAMEQGEMYRCECRFVRRDGTMTWVYGQAVPMHDESGVVDGFMGSITDISDRKVAEEQLERHAKELTALNAELVRSNQDLDDFAYIASHDLKEPLRGISNYATFLGEDYEEQLDEEGRRLLGTIRRLCERMELLIESLLKYSRVGHAELDMERVPIAGVVADVLESLQLLLQEKNAEVVVADNLPTALCDPVRIGEVFHNLLTNALKYNENETPRIEIGYVRENSEHRFCIRDNGIGIDPRHLESIFGMFKRLHGRDEYGGGAGAGLTITKKLVERHEGTIWVESSPGAGATFWFSLPARRPR